MTRFMALVDRYRKGIGYTIGWLNVASGFSNIIAGDAYTGGLNLAIGAFLIIDTWTFKPK